MGQVYGQYQDLSTIIEFIIYTCLDSSENSEMNFSYTSDEQQFDSQSVSSDETLSQSSVTSETARNNQFYEELIRSRRETSKSLASC